VWHVRLVSFAENHVLVGELMEAKANVGDHGGAYAPQGNGNLAWLNDADINGATGGYSLGFALTVIQVFIWS
jgi:exocyst complex component 4